MDPVSAVGFVASLNTLIGVVIGGSKVAASLYTSLKEAPQDVRRLLDNVRSFEFLIVELDKKTKEYLGADRMLPEHLQRFCIDRFKQMEVDFRGFKDQLEHLHSLLAGQTLSKVYVRARIKKVFSENNILKYQAVLSDHRETLTLFFSLLSE